MATELVRPLYLYRAEDISKEIVLSRKKLDKYSLLLLKVNLQRKKIRILND